MLSVSQAAKLLGINNRDLLRIPNETLPVFTTPGGHRRYQHLDVSKLVGLVDILPPKKRRGPSLNPNKSSGHSLYFVWYAMIDRCENPNNKSYKNWGGRGIKVCPEWHNYVVFREWALPLWEKGLTLDRKDNSGHYTPENCRFVTWKINANNRRNNRLITHQGETHNINEWAERLGLPIRLIRSRLLKKYPVDKVLSLKRNPFSESKFYGVYRETHNGKWRAIARGVSIGTYCTEEDAARAYNQYIESKGMSLRKNIF